MSEAPAEPAIPVRDSILASTKKNLGIPDGETGFDDDVIMHINTVLNKLNDLGVGPVNGYMVQGREDRWDDFILPEDIRYNSAKTLVFLQVKMYFDPPGTPHHIAAIDSQINELEYRIYVRREATEWAEPIIPLSEPLL